MSIGSAGGKYVKNNLFQKGDLLYSDGFELVRVPAGPDGTKVVSSGIDVSFSTAPTQAISFVRSVIAIAQTTASATTNINITSIPSGYKRLRAIVHWKLTSAAIHVGSIGINAASNTASSLTYITSFVGTGEEVGSQTYHQFYGAGSDSTSVGTAIIDFPIAADHASVGGLPNTMFMISARYAYNENNATINDYWVLSGRDGATQVYGAITSLHFNGSFGPGTKIVLYGFNE
jgi:hypothetical protein